jgi:hypothetical protein
LSYLSEVAGVGVGAPAPGLTISTTDNINVFGESPKEATDIASILMGVRANTPVGGFASGGEKGHTPVNLGNDMEYDI